MSKDREQILRMLADGKISVAEAEQLLDAIGGQNQLEKDEEAAGATKKAKYLRIQVEPGPDSTSERVNIRVPLQLVRAGVKLASVIPGPAREKANAKLREKGINLDLNDLNSDDLDAVITSLAETSIDVEDGDEKVKIYCE